MKCCLSCIMKKKINLLPAEIAPLQKKILKIYKDEEKCFQEGTWL